MSKQAPRIALMLDLQWPYKRHADLFAGAHRFALEQGWELTIDEYLDDTLRTRLESGQPSGLDGIIARATRLLAEVTGELEVPLVNVWHSSPVRESLPGVFPDFAVAGRLRAEHLLSRGLHHFAALGCRSDQGQSIEARTFDTCVREAGHSCAIGQISLAFSRTLAQWRKTDETLTEWMSHWRLPVGVSVGSESVGRIIVQKCRERGWRVPEDVAIIAGRNEEVLCERPRPALTSMEMNYERVGYEAARVLGDLMQARRKSTQTRPANRSTEKDATDKHATKPGHAPTLIPPRGLVVRESTDFFAVEDQLVASALEFIARNSHRSIGQDDVSRAVGAQTRTLQLRFRKALDRPIAAEIRRVRLERAKRELTQSKRPLAEIARDVGFGAAMRMYEVFRRELGVTPSEYRKQRQQRD